MHPLIPAFLAQTALEAANSRMLMRREPVKRAAAKRGNELVKAFGERSKDLAGDKAPVKVQIQSNKPPSREEIAMALQNATTPEEFKQAAQVLSPLKYAGNASAYTLKSDGTPDILKGERQPATVYTNPNADEAYFAHELGHTASTNTKFGDSVRRARDFIMANPALGRSIAAAGAITPLAAAIMTPGDDDTDEAMLGAIALQSPTLIDEALATKNALAIMERSGQRASLGQRARLAGGYLSYLIGPATLAAAANLVGNQFDEDV